MDTPEAEQLPRAWTRDRRERVAKEQAAQSVRSCTVQNEIDGVLVRMSTRRCMKDSLFWKDKSFNSRLCEDERGHSERDEEAQVPWLKSRNLCV